MSYLYDIFFLDQVYCGLLLPCSDEFKKNPAPGFNFLEASQAYIQFLQYVSHKFHTRKEV